MAILRAALITAICLCAGLASASPSAKAKAAALRTECTHSAGLCVSVPAAWRRIGDIFNDLGFVAAEPSAGAAPESWPQLTVAAFAAPQPDKAGSSSTLSLDTLVDRMLAPEGALASAQTLQRSRLLLNGAPAQIVRVEFRDDTGKPTTVEEVALIEGDDGLIYSIALHCAPQEIERLDPIFRQAAQSWHLEEAAPSSAQPRPSAEPRPAQRPSPALPNAPHPKPNSAKP